MGLFGGGSSSKSYTDSFNSTETREDNSTVAAETGSAVRLDGSELGEGATQYQTNNVRVSDYGAIEKALDFAGGVAGSSIDNMRLSANDSLQSSNTLAQRAIAAAEGRNIADTDKVVGDAIKWVGRIAAAAVIGYFVTRAVKGK